MKIQDYSVNCDWLAYSVHLLFSHSETLEEGIKLTAPEGYRLDLLPGTTIFKHRVIVRNDSTGQRVLTFLYFPYSKIIKDTICLVEVDNQELYNHGWERSFSIMEQIHDCVFSNFSRIDTCCDFIPSDHQSSTILDIARGDVYLKRYTTKTTFQDTTDGANFQPYCINWGKPTTNIKWKLYNKSKEIFEPRTIDGQRVNLCKKPWIVEEWTQCNINWTSSDVWRLEVSISYTGGSTCIHTGAPLTWTDVVGNWFEWVTLFSSMYISKFKLRRNEGHIKHQNDTEVPFLNFSEPYYDRELLTPKKYTQRPPNYELTDLIKAIMRQLDTPAVLYNIGAINTLISTLSSIIEENNLESFFVRYYKTTPAQLYNRLIEVNAERVIDVAAQANIINHLK